MTAEIAGFLFGTLLLIIGADSFVRGAAGLALRSGAGSYTVALLSTALGALVPALAVTLAAGFSTRPELALGNLIGSSIAQLGLVLGICALTASLRARMKLFAWLDPAAIAAAVLVWLLALDARIGTIDGVILILAYIVVAALVVRGARREDQALRNELENATGTDMLVWRDGLRVVVGVLILPFAAVWLVDGALAIADGLALSPIVVGLVLLGAATALASVWPTVLAARRGQSDFAIGHALGAVLGNLLLLLGGLALWQTVAVARSLQHVEIPALVVLAVAIYPMMRSDGELSRREGIILVVAYAVFLVGESWLAKAG
ncbi:MAG TPA: hypothetical protein VFG55_04745 [Rhodanobacteraceae bacterium]|nr:hypothetical protein [Rhodanobacteraceae bacterium]